MLVVDTSAIIAILNKEHDQLTYVNAIQLYEYGLVSCSAVLEATMVLVGKKYPNPCGELESFFQVSNISVIGITHTQTVIAQQAFLQYGKGRHKAALNFVDCFSYALAKEKNLPLLFKGDDFTHTDIESAISIG